MNLGGGRSPPRERKERTLSGEVPADGKGGRGVDWDAWEAQEEEEEEDAILPPEPPTHNNEIGEIFSKCGGANAVTGWSDFVPPQGSGGPSFLPLPSSVFSSSDGTVPADSFGVFGNGCWNGFGGGVGGECTVPRSFKEELVEGEVN